MALKHRVTLGVALLMVLIVVAILPPRTCSEVENWDLTATVLCSGTRFPWGRSHREAVDRARNVLARRLREHELADSLRALADVGRGVRSADGSLVVLHEAPLTADSARAWLALALAERDRVATGSPHARIVVALDTRRRAAARDGRPPVYRSDPQARRFTSVSGRDTTCFVTLRLSQASRYDTELVETDDRGSYGVFLGTCGLVGHFGAAGTTALLAARNAFFNERTAFGPRRSTAVPERRGDARQVDPSDYRFTGCVKGETRACASLIGYGSPTDGWMRNAYGMLASREFLTYLREVDGPEKFRRFWQSPLGGEAALADAFGRPAAETVRAWAQHDYRLPDDGPVDVGAMALAATFWLGAGLVAALAIGKYRQASA